MNLGARLVGGFAIVAAGAVALESGGLGRHYITDAVSAVSSPFITIDGGLQPSDQVAINLKHHAWLNAAGNDNWIFENAAKDHSIFFGKNSFETFKDHHPNVTELTYEYKQPYRILGFGVSG